MKRPKQPESPARRYAQSKRLPPFYVRESAFTQLPDAREFTEREIRKLLEDAFNAGAKSVDGVEREGKPTCCWCGAVDVEAACEVAVPVPRASF